MMERCGLWYGSGKHACIGQHFAQAQMLKVLAMMIMKLEVSQSFRYFRPRN
jgi:cytochrome P450